MGKKTLTIILFTLYCLLLLWLLFFGVGRHLRMPINGDIAQYMRFNSNFYPFKTIMNYIHAYSVGTISEFNFSVNIFGNIFAFAPMGIFLPAIFKKFRSFFLFAFIMLLLLVTVELGQLITFTGSCDIDDVILNLSGAILFYGFWRIWHWGRQ